MADYIVTSGELTTVANAIREKNGTSSNLSWPNGFVSGISSGSGGGDYIKWKVSYENDSLTVTNDEALPLFNQLFKPANNQFIRVTFDGETYIFSRQLTGTNIFYGGTGTESDLEYPVALLSSDPNVSNAFAIYATQGTHSIKIEIVDEGPVIV